MAPAQLDRIFVVCYLGDTHSARKVCSATLHAGTVARLEAAFAMNVLRRIDDVAAATGVSPARLRRWCATGLLHCEHDRRGWLIRTIDLGELDELADAIGRATRGSQPIAFIVPSDRAGSGTLAEIARRIDVPLDDVSRAEVAVDGVSYAALSWPSIGDGASVEAIAELALLLDGELIDDESWMADQRPGNERASAA